MTGNTTSTLFYSTADMEANDSTSMMKYYEDEEKLAEIFSHLEAVGLSVYIGVLSLFGIIANAITFVVIMRTRKLNQSAFYIILMSLCVSDFLSAVISPFILYRITWGFYEWSMPVFFCKAVIATDFWTSCSTIQHILVFGLLRLLALQFPHKFQLITTLHAKVVVAIIWLETFGVGFVIYFLWPNVYPPGQRTPNDDLRKACTASQYWIGMLAEYVRIGIPIVVYIPLGIVLIVTSILIGLIARRTSKRNKADTAISSTTDRKEKHALIQLTLIVASFLLGYIPDITYKIVAASLRNQNLSLPARVEWQFFATAYCLLRLSECLNPIFYNLGSSNMREATKRYLGIGRKRYAEKTAQT